MSGKKLSNQEIQGQAEALTSGLAGLNGRDAVKILCTAIGIIVSQPERDSDEFNEGIRAVNLNLNRRRPGGVYRVARDPEIKAFIHGLDRYLSLHNLRKELIKRFGKNRAPSISSLHRYLQKISKGENKNAQGRDSHNS